MLDDILNSPIEVKIGDEAYLIEFDNASYAQVEKTLGMGVYKAYEHFVLDNNLTAAENIDILCIGMAKHHDREEIAAVKKELLKTAFLSINNIYALKFAFAKPLSIPQAAQKDTAKKKTIKKKSLKK